MFAVNCLERTKILWPGPGIAGASGVEPPRQVKLAGKYGYRSKQAVIFSAKKR